MFENFRINEALLIMRRCRLIRPKAALGLVVYYGIAVLNAAMDGVSLVLLIDLITGNASLNGGASVVELASRALSVFSIEPDYTALYLLVIALFLVRVGLMLAYTAIDGYFEASLRRIIQEEGFSSVLRGDWEALRSIRVGARVGAVTEEASNAAKYFMSAARSVYSLLAVTVLSIVAMAVSFEITVLFLAIGLPVMLVLRYLFNIQARVAEKLVAERQGFYANTTERLHGLFQIKVEGNAQYHIAQGLKNQKRLTRLEVRWWNLRAVINAFNVLLPVIVLAGGWFWAAYKGIDIKDLMAAMAGVGIVGARALAQLNQLTANIGNITCFAGSMGPVHALFSIPEEPHKAAAPERIIKVDVSGVSYHYNEKAGVAGIDVSAAIGFPLILMGPSGSGKTTLANLIAGLYRPSAGSVVYEGASGRSYNSLEYRPRVGYVTQDIHLFHGTVRDNVKASLGEAVDDACLLECLNQAGAEGFVAEMGGLDAVIAEAGRSLSGGQRRRLGIARVLMARPDILILDEVTAGLDEERKKELIATIRKLSASVVVVMITHDVRFEEEFGTVFTFNR